MFSNTSDPQLEPTTYHKNVVHFLKHNSPEFWEMYQTQATRENLSSETLSLLLKNSVRLDSETHHKVYAIGKEVARKLECEVPVTFYQTTDVGSKNAMLFFVPEEIHIVFQGDILETLDELEMKALIAHEIGHYRLWTIENGTYYITDRLLENNADCENASVSQIVTTRNYQLYNEIFADMGSLFVTEDLHAVISALIKIQTGLKKTNVAAFLEQAEELSQKGDIFSEGYTHPEAIIRARALELLDSDIADSEKRIAEMIEGTPTIEKMDVLLQEKLQRITKEVVIWYLSPLWMQGDALITHAGFLGIQRSDISPELSETLLEEVTGLGDSFDDYFSYILIDFVALDNDLEDIPLVRALYIADELGIRSSFEKLICKELKYRKNYLGILWSQKDEIFQKAEMNWNKEQEA